MVDFAEEEESKDDDDSKTGGNNLFVKIAKSINFKVNSKFTPEGANENGFTFGEPLIKYIQSNNQEKVAPIDDIRFLFRHLSLTLKIVVLIFLIVSFHHFLRWW